VILPLLLALLLTLGVLRAHAGSETLVELFDAHGHRIRSALVARARAAWSPNLALKLLE
jgi:hypothetical protein